MNNKQIFVIVPAYNEEKTIEDVIKKIKQQDMNLEVLVIDDGSKDRTKERAKEAGAIAVKHLLNLGQWAALRTAFTISLLNHAKVVITLDGDGQHAPEDLMRIVDPVFRKEADFVIGSRFIHTRKPKMTNHRYYGIKFFNKLLKLRIGLPLSDCTSGYRAYDAGLIASLLPRLRENQYGALEAIIQASKLNARIYEVPISNIPSRNTTKGKLRYAYNLLRTIIRPIL